MKPSSQPQTNKCEMTMRTFALTAFGAENLDAVMGLPLAR
jgi:hypothetical protein